MSSEQLKKADSRQERGEISMDLVARVQRELTSEEKCLKISFSLYILLNVTGAASPSTEPLSSDRMFMHVNWLQIIRR